MKHSLSVLVSICLLTAGQAIAADDYLAPIYWRNTSPFTLTHGLPRARPAAILSPGQQRWSMNVEAANSFTSKTTLSLDAQLDGETSLVALDWNVGLRGGYEVGIELPWVRHHTGYLDTLIDHYHDLTGLPEKDRGKFPEDQLNFLLEYDGVTYASLQDEVSGIGDVRLHVGRTLSSDDAGTFSIRAELKLPTGDADDLTGSGAADASVTLARSTMWELAGIPLTIHLAGGLLYMGTGDFAPDLQNRIASLGFASFATRFAERWSLAVQVDAHSALYDIDHGVPGSWSIQGGVSVRRGFGERWMSELVIYEDLRPGSATDFTLALRLTLRTH